MAGRHIGQQVLGNEQPLDGGVDEAVRRRRKAFLAVPTVRRDAHAMSRDLYDILDVPADASQGEITTAYRRLMFMLDPERDHDPDAAMRLAEVANAYEVVGNPAERRRYDRLHPRPLSRRTSNAVSRRRTWPAGAVIAVAVCLVAIMFMVSLTSEMALRTMVLEQVRNLEGTFAPRVSLEQRYGDSSGGRIQPVDQKLLKEGDAPATLP